jgi:hypothetical protein
VCLAEHYSPGKLPFRCGKGHEWTSPGAAILRGSWCPRCAGWLPPSERLELIREFARRKGGELLSARYENTHKLLHWKCARGHSWKASWSNVFSKTNHTWCPHCAGVARGGLADLEALASARGGRSLAREYKNRKTPVEWRCEFGHVWTATASGVWSGTWCPFCGRHNPITIERVQLEARRMGGRCISKTLRDGETRIRLECADGHRWTAAAKNVTGGHWCAVCRYRWPAGTAERIAQRRGGSCDPPRGALRSSAVLSWKCGRGHVWETTLALARRGHWCPHCRGRAATLELLRSIARWEGGALVSRSFTQRTSPLQWRCRAGHLFEATTVAVLRDSWCDRCPRRRR